MARIAPRHLICPPETVTRGYSLSLAHPLAGVAEHAQPRRILAESGWIPSGTPVRVTVADGAAVKVRQA